MGYDLYSLRNPDDISILEPGQAYLIPWLGFTKNIYNDFYRHNYKPGRVALKQALSDESPIEFSLKYISNGKHRSFRFDRPLFQLAIEAGLTSTNDTSITREDSEIEEFNLTGAAMFRSIHLRGDFKTKEMVKNHKPKENTESIISFFRDSNYFMCHTKVDASDRLNIRSTSFGGNAVGLFCWGAQESFSDICTVRDLVLNMKTLFERKQKVSHIKVETVDVELDDGSWFRIHTSNGHPWRLSDGFQGAMSKQSWKFLCDYGSALSYLLYQEESTDLKISEDLIDKRVSRRGFLKFLEGLTKI
jgi:hypothetical protein